jgi:CHAT domain-containing protein
MHDRPLTVPEIAALDLPGAELAFLSACETAASAALPDEAISAAAALQLAGYRHVIATLWPIPDRSAVAGAVYREGGAPADPARALHDAILAAMAANPYEPTSWAPYQHLGP